MKAVSSWQPWASAIAVRAKRIETRGWATSYRGPLAIHAAKRYVRREMQDMGCDPTWRAALNHVQVSSLAWLPYGAIVAVCVLVDCRRTEDFGSEIEVARSREGISAVYDWMWTESDMGNFEPGRWGWVLADVRAIEPVPYRGERGLFEIPDSLVPTPEDGEEEPGT